MKRFITIAISLLLAAGPAAARRGGARETALAGEDLKRAEQLADRFAQRFRETLDFEVVYREFFILDDRRRLRNSAAMVFDPERHERIKNELSPAEIEQTYIGFMSLHYLVALYLSNVLTEEAEESGAIESRELFPPELLKAMKEPSTCFFFKEYLEDESCKDTPELFQTAEDVRVFARHSNYLAGLFRKYMPREPFMSPGYKAHVGQLDWDGRETSVRQGDDYFGFGEETTVYQTYRELIVLNVVEENGEMRVAGIPIGN